MPNDLPNQREAVILALLLHGEIHGREIRNKYEERTKRAMPYGSLYTTLDRMLAKGLIDSRQGESVAERGGNRRRYYKVTGSGVKAYNDFVRSLHSTGFQAGEAVMNGR